MSLTRNLTQPLTRPIPHAITQAVGGGGAVVSNTVDVFLVAGQSNVVGNGTSAQSPAAPYGMRVVSGTISALADPLVMANGSTANTGSAWPAFANEWTAQTGNRCAIVPYGINGSGLVAAGQTWSPTGGWRGFAKDELLSAITAINAHPDYTVGSVYVVWHQGETEAGSINGTTITGSTYEQALEDLAAYWAANIPNLVTVGVVNISGTGAGGGVVDQMAARHAGYQEIRAAQSRAASDSANLSTAYDGAYHFIARGYNKDGTHHNQSGLNLLGKMAARGLANPAPPPTLTSPVLATTNYIDPSTDFVSTRTAAHTTAATTDCIVVAVAMEFHDNASDIGTPAMTFGGVTMRLCGFSNVRFTGGGAGGSVTAAVFYLDAATYGASLSAVTQNIVLTVPGAPRAMDWTVLDTKGIEVAEAEAGGFPAADAGATTATATITTLYPSLIVSAAASIASSASTLTGTLTNSTEVLDNSNNVAGTRSGQSLIGYTWESAPVTAKAITATWSANCTHRTIVSIALRAKIPGE